jgi:hypothetical protein
LTPRYAYLAAYHARSQYVTEALLKRRDASLKDITATAGGEAEPAAEDQGPTAGGARPIGPLPQV